MRTSDKGIKLIKEFEGCVLHSYDDGYGNLTIGYGHCSDDVYEGQTITQEQAEELLRKDLRRFEENVNEYTLHYNFNQNEFDALVSFAYNIGSVDEMLRYGEIERNAITDRMMLYVHSGTVIVEGLVRRRTREVELFKTPVKSVHNISYYANLVADTIKGVYGVDEIRKAKLGEDYKIVQGAINTLWDYIAKNIK